MITEIDQQKIADVFRIPRLSVNSYRHPDNSDKNFIIDHFWLIKIRNYAGYYWYDLMLAMIKTRTTRYGLIVIPDELVKSNTNLSLKPIQLFDETDEVLQTMSQANFVIKERLNPFFDGGYRYDLMMVSDSVNLQLAVQSSNHPATVKLTDSIIAELNKIVTLYDNEDLNNLISKRE